MNILNFSLKPLVDPKFIFTSLATYEQNGVIKSWEIVKAHDSVAILLYHTDKDSFVLVKQFRPATYANGHNSGISLELCAGILDKNLTLPEIIKEEIEEECGYNVPLRAIEKISSFYTSVGFSGSKQTLYYAEINDSMKVGNGGGVDDEFIEIVYIDVSEAKRVIYDDDIIKTPGLMFAFCWWYENKKTIKPI
ncbi:MAG: NUDIX domain-containing protein [Sulfurovaceae bacterium]|nr:NUDIX domain-containing protein [Sulfurovaceae bacterium]